MRTLIVLLGTALTALLVGAGVAAGGPDKLVHGGSCQTVAPDRMICFEAWGVAKTHESASGNGTTIDLFHRHFMEFTAGVLTFEQRDKIHHVAHTDASGATHVDIMMFSGWSTPSGLVCRWKDHFVTVDGEIVHSVEDFSCEGA
jgi:hypothetical protein